MSSKNIGHLLCGECGKCLCPIQWLGFMGRNQPPVIRPDFVEEMYKNVLNLREAAHNNRKLVKYDFCCFHCGSNLGQVRDERRNAFSVFIGNVPLMGETHTGERIDAVNSWKKDQEKIPFSNIEVLTKWESLPWQKCSFYDAIWVKCIGGSGAEPLVNVVKDVKGKQEEKVRGNFNVKLAGDKGPGVGESSGVNIKKDKVADHPKESVMNFEIACVHCNETICQGDWLCFVQDSGLKLCIQPIHYDGLLDSRLRIGPKNGPKLYVYCNSSACGKTLGSVVLKGENVFAYFQVRNVLRESFCPKKAKKSWEAVRKVSPAVAAIPIVPGCLGHFDEFKLKYLPADKVEVEEKDVLPSNSYDYNTINNTNSPSGDKKLPPFEKKRFEIACGSCDKEICPINNLLFVESDGGIDLSIEPSIHKELFVDRMRLKLNGTSIPIAIQCKCGSFCGVMRSKDGAIFVSLELSMVKFFECTEDGGRKIMSKVAEISWKKLRVKMIILSSIPIKPLEESVISLNSLFSYYAAEDMKGNGKEKAEERATLELVPHVTLQPDVGNIEDLPKKSVKSFEIACVYCNETICRGDWLCFVQDSGLKLCIQPMHYDGLLDSRLRIGPKSANELYMFCNSSSCGKTLGSVVQKGENVFAYFIARNVLGESFRPKKAKESWEAVRKVSPAVAAIPIVPGCLGHFDEFKLKYLSADKVEKEEKLSPIVTPLEVPTVTASPTDVAKTGGMITSVGDSDSAGVSINEDEVANTDGILKAEDRMGKIDWDIQTTIKAIIQSMNLPTLQLEEVKSDRVDRQHWIDSFGDLEPVEVAGDGNCQFRALSIILFGSEDNYVFVRTQIADYMRRNASMFKDTAHADVSTGQHYNDLSEFCDAVERGTEWGNYDTLKAFSALNRINVQVISSGFDGKGALLPAIGQYDESCTVFLAHYTEWHYAAIRPRDITKTEEDTAFNVHQRPSQVMTSQQTRTEKQKATTIELPLHKTAMSGNEPITDLEPVELVCKACEVALCRFDQLCFVRGSDIKDVQLSIFDGSCKNTGLILRVNRTESARRVPYHIHCSTDCPEHCGAIFRSRDSDIYPIFKIACVKFRLKNGSVLKVQGGKERRWYTERFLPYLKKVPEMSHKSCTVLSENLTSYFTFDGATDTNAEYDELENAEDSVDLFASTFDTRSDDTVKKFMMSLSEHDRLAELVISRYRAKKVTHVAICRMLQIEASSNTNEHKAVKPDTVTKQLIRKIQHSVSEISSILSKEVDGEIPDDLLDQVENEYRLLGFMINHRLYFQSVARKIMYFLFDQVSLADPELRSKAIRLLSAYISASLIRMSTDDGNKLREIADSVDEISRKSLNSIIINSRAGNPVGNPARGTDEFVDAKKVVCLRCGETDHFEFSCPKNTKLKEQKVRNAADSKAADRETSMYVNSLMKEERYEDRSFAQFQKLRRAYETKGEFLNYREFQEEIFKVNNAYNFRSLPITVKDLLTGVKRMISTITGYIYAATGANLIITLYDLEKLILQSKDFVGIERFSELGLGPLVRNPEVIRFFGPSQRVLWSRVVPEFTREDIFEHLAEELAFLGRRRRFNDLEVDFKQNSMDVEDMLKSFAVKNGLDEIGDLCVHIHASSFVTFMVSSLSRVQRISFSAFEKKWSLSIGKIYREKAIGFRQKADTIFVDLQKLTKTISDPFEAYRIVQKYCDTNLVSSSITNSLILLAVEKLSPLSSKAKSLTFMIKDEERITEDMLAVLGSLATEEQILDSLVRAEAHFLGLVKARSHRDTPISFLQFLAKVPSLAGMLAAAFHNSGTGSYHSQVPIASTKVAREEIINSILGEVSGLKGDQISIFAFLAELESTILRYFGVNSFDSLGFGSFLSFCSTSEADLAELMRDLSKVQTGSFDDEELFFRVKTFMRPIARALSKFGSIDIQSHLSSWIIAASRHFGTDIERLLNSLGPDSVNKIQQYLQSDEEHESQLCLLTAWTLSCGTMFPSTYENESESNALKAIASSPLLEDIETSIHWHERFHTSLGPFPSFLRQIYSEKPDKIEKWEISMLEISVDKFVRVDYKPKMEKFDESLHHGDPVLSTACAIGFVVRSGDSRLAPLQILSEHVLSWSKQAQSVDLARFSLKSMVAFPEALRISIWTPVFWTPINSVLDNAQGRVIAACESEYEMSVIRATGHLLGIVNWISVDRVRAETAVRLNQAPTAHTSNLNIVVPKSKLSKLPVEKTMTNISGGNTLSLPIQKATKTSVFEGAGSLEECNEFLESQRRKYGFGTDETMSPEDKKSLIELRELANRSIGIVSGELYSEDVHFILELTQNADDNSYDTDAPILHIKMMEDAVELRNNEQGFSCENVRALCSVGESTKAKSVSGYIGHKGIGFKSVFKVCDSPVIHSRNWHFSFSSNSESGLNFILPTVMNPPIDWNPMEAMTLIRLPVPETSQSADQTRELRASVDEIHPSLLLFLHRINSIIIEDVPKKTRKDLVRAQHDDGIVCIEQNFYESNALVRVIRDDWFLVRRILSVPSDVQRLGMTKTEIIFAFPVTSSENINKDLEPQNVFCFLPLRSYGFKFILQADWVTTSSREGVSTSSAWNQWLRSEVAETFKHVVSRFVERAAALNRPARFVAEMEEEEESLHNESETESEDGSVTVDTIEHIATPEDIETATDFLNLLFKMLPVPRTVTEFFASVPQEISSILEDCKFIPVRRGGFFSPMFAVIPPENVDDDSLIEITERYLSELGLSFVHYVSIPTSVATVLKIRHLNDRLLYDLLAVASLDFTTVESVDFEWLAWMLNLVGEDPHCRDLIREYSGLRLLPMTNGLFSSCSEGSVYSMPETVAVEDHLVFQDVRLIHPDFLIEVRAFRYAERLLRMMGVEQVDGHKFVVKHVLQILSDKLQSAEVLCNSLAYALKHSLKCSQCQHGKLEELILKSWPNTLILDKYEGKNPISNSSLHLGHEYGCKKYTVLSEETWLVVSDKYLKFHEKSADWAKFFKKLDIIGSLHMQEKTMYVSLEIVEQSFSEESLKIIRDLAENTEDSARNELEVSDWTSQDVSTILRHICSKNDIALAKVLLGDLQQWKETANSATVKIGSKSAEIKSSVFEQLCKVPWIPSNSSSLMKPSQLYYPNEKLKKLGCDLPFVSNACTAELAMILGIQNSITPAKLITLISTWPEVVTKSIEDMKGIYRFALTKDSGFDVKGLKFIFVPHHVKIRKEFMMGQRRVNGRLYSIDQLVLDDPSGLVDSDKSTILPKTQHLMSEACSLRRLKAFYREEFLETFKLLGVSEKPSSDQYCDILRKISFSKPNAASCQIAVRLFCNWTWKDSFDGEDSTNFDSIRPLFSQNKWIPTGVDGEWTNTKDNLFIFDSRNISLDDFDGNVLAPMTNTEEFHVRDGERQLLDFYDRLGVPKISDYHYYACRTGNVKKQLPANSIKYLCLLVSLLQNWKLEENEKSVLQKIFQSLSVVYAEDVKLISVVKNEENVKFESSGRPRKIVMDLSQSCIFIENGSDIENSDYRNAFESGLAGYVAPHSLIYLSKAIRELHDVAEKYDAVKSTEILDRLAIRLTESDIPGFERTDNEEWLVSLAPNPMEKYPDSVSDAVMEQYPDSVSDKSISDGMETSTLDENRLDPALAAAMRSVKTLREKASTGKSFSIGGSGMASATNGAHLALNGNKSVDFPSLPSEHPIVSEFEATWDEIPVDLDTLPTIFDDYLTNSTDAVGRYGENVVNDLLKNDARYKKVEWINEKKESFLPYDLRVKDKDDRTIYVEVKTTLTQEKNFFEISLNELLFSRKNGGNFIIYRVFGVSSQIRILRIVDPSKYFGQAITLFARL